MDSSLPVVEQRQNEEGFQPLRPSSAPEQHGSYEAVEPEHELGMWLQTLHSFFRAHNHPFAESEPTAALTRDWYNELAIARQTLLRISQLSLRMVQLKDARDAAEGTAEEGNLLAGLGLSDELLAEETEQVSDSLVGLSESLSDLYALCGTLLEVRPVSFYTWSTLGKILVRELERSEAAQSLTRASHTEAAANLPPSLFELSRLIDAGDALSTDILTVFSELVRLLERLRYVETALRRDRPLKQALPIFCLVYEEARGLLEFIEKRALRTEGLKEEVFDTLDGTNYAIAMELRKVFSRELVGLSALRPSPTIYARVENAHGLLRDCFQQSIVGLAQLFDPSLDGARLFNTFQTKLEQSLLLRYDLWMLLQLVRRAEKERDRQPLSRLIELLEGFREGSQRYLMYKDWEACERFIEEVSAGHGTVEVTPVLHRFGAYLETLHGQVNMRAVLADHPFDYPSLTE